jgi:glycosyltransferase involved in cell wall biosynthesis
VTDRRVTIVASEVLGRAGAGGAGTADSLLAVALARRGHRVRVLVATGREFGTLDAEWTSRYASAGVEVQVLERLGDVRPAFLRPTFEVFHAVRADPPDVLIVNDWRGLGYAAQRARQLGLGLQETACVVHCHGPARVLAEFAQKVPDTLARFGEEVTERASIELADAVVSPSAWLLEWMRAHSWPVPAPASVIPYVRESVALGKPPPSPPESARIRRLAFFGQLREGKGLRIYLDALNALDPSLLDGAELLFLGRDTPRWSTEAIESAVGSTTRAAVVGVRVETNLDRAQALTELRRPGTLAVMPSLLDNSPNTVTECIENGIPFVSTSTGGIPEVVAEEDQGRVLCRPNAGDLAAALARALEAPEGFAPARSARDPVASLESWFDLVESVSAPVPSRPLARLWVDVVVTSDESENHAQRLVAASTEAEAGVLRTAFRGELERSSAEWVLFLDDDDVPDDGFLDQLVAAQRASGADAVTCAVHPHDAPESTLVFLGAPGALGLVENHYGVVGLVRRSLVDPRWALDSATDPDWVLYSHLALAGARIVSVPEPLATHRGKPGMVGDVPGDGLTVLEAFERQAISLFDLPQLTATLAAAHARAQAQHRPPAPEPLARRGLRVLHTEGPRGFVRKVRSRLQASARLNPLRFR